MLSANFEPTLILKPLPGGFLDSQNDTLHTRFDGEVQTEARRLGHRLAPGSS